MHHTANGTIIDYTPLSNSQLINMVNDLLVTTKTDKKHLAEVFALVNGFSVKDNHQIFHPSTQLHPAGDPAQTHWHEETSTDPLSKADDFSEKRYVESSHKLCQTGLDCLDPGDGVCIIYDQMATRFCRSVDF
jgi:hypothetical protein